ncbi:MAG: GxxExxY protein [Caldilineaceae bacterium]
MNRGQTINQVTGTVLGAAIDVHRALGPGLLESAYQRCLCYELKLRTLPFVQELSLPVRYKGMDVDAAYRIDLLVDDRVVVEIKAVQIILPIHTAQLITYLKLGNWPVGLLINFNVELLKNGVTRLANNYTGPLPSIPEDSQ